MRKQRRRISFAVTAKLISAFVFATQIVQFLFYLNPKFQASSHRLWLYSPVCVGPGRKPRRRVSSQRGSYRNEKIQTCTNMTEIKAVFSDLPLSATLKIMVLSSQTLEFVIKDNIYSFGQNKSLSLVIGSWNSVLVKK